MVNVDAVTYAADATRLGPVPTDRYHFARADVADAAAMDRALAGADLVVHFAAESHVDRSIQDPGAFVRTNVVGTHTLLEAARRADVARFHQVSTDEVFGSLPLDASAVFNEESPYAPRSPYAATKAAADLLVASYGVTYGLEVTASYGSNTYGPFQFPEKLIPRLATRALAGETLPVYGTGVHVRDWIHVDDHCAGIEAVVQRGRAGRRYCLGGGAERSNLDVARAVCRVLGREASAIQFVTDRPGHDLRYAMDTRRARSEVDWAPRCDFEAGLAATVDWYRRNRPWWEAHRDASERFYATDVAAAR